MSVGLLVGTSQLAYDLGKLEVKVQALQERIEKLEKAGTTQTP